MSIRTPSISADFKVRTNYVLCRIQELIRRIKGEIPEDFENSMAFWGVKNSLFSIHLTVQSLLWHLQCSKFRRPRCSFDSYKSVEDVEIDSLATYPSSSKEEALAHPVLDGVVSREKMRLLRHQGTKPHQVDNNQMWPIPCS